MIPSADTTKMPDGKLTVEMNALLAEIRRLACETPSLKALQERIVQAIAESFPYYNWTGFYSNTLKPGAT